MHDQVYKTGKHAMDGGKMCLVENCVREDCLTAECSQQFCCLHHASASASGSCKGFEEDTFCARTGAADFATQIPRITTRRVRHECGSAGEK